MFLFVLFASLSVMLVSLSGKLLTWRVMGSIIARNQSLLVSFAAGVFIIIIANLLRELVEETGSVAAGMPWVLLGAVFVLMVFRVLPTFHHHHEEADTHSHALDANRVLLSDGLHNVGDGVLLAASFAISPVFGLFTTASVMVHEFVQEVSEFFVLREAGMSVNRALLYNFMVSSSILVGAVGGTFLLAQFEALHAPLLGIAAGSFLIVVLNDLLPHSLRSSASGKRYARHLAWFLLGLAVMGSVSALFGHGHDEEAEGSHEERLV